MSIYPELAELTLGQFRTILSIKKPLRLKLFLGCDEAHLQAAQDASHAAMASLQSAPRKAIPLILRARLQPQLINNEPAAGGLSADSQVCMGESGAGAHVRQVRCLVEMNA